MKIVIAACGSLGHLNPALATAEEIKRLQPSADIFFIIDRKLANRHLDKVPYQYQVLSGRPSKSAFAWQNAFFLVEFIIDIFKSFRILAKIKPDYILGFGGHSSAAFIIASSFLKIPSLIHEQNLIPGKANKLAGYFTGHIATSFPETEKYFNQEKVFLSGNPVSRSKFDVSPVKARTNFKLDPDLFTILVLGGSQGSNNINKAVVAAISQLSKDEKIKLQVLHACGIGNKEELVNQYQERGIFARVDEFIGQSGWALVASDLVISRAGAGTITELSYAKRPVILIPFKYAGGHQAKNARNLKSSKSAIVIEEDELDQERLISELRNLIDDPIKREELSANIFQHHNPKAAEIIAEKALKA